LLVAGNRNAPDSNGLALARELPNRFDSLIPSIQTGLFDHYVPYQEAVVAGKLPALSEQFPTIKGKEDIWPYVSPAHILIKPFRGIPTIEIAFRVEWDEEHAVGAIFQKWQFVELCGSV
jgi:hypothetical protein